MDSVAPGGREEVRGSRLFAALSYLGFLCVLPLVFKKENRFAGHHARQGLVLFVLEILFFIVSVLPLFGTLKGMILAVFVFVSLWGILQSLRGNYSRIPLLWGLADKITL